VSVRVAYMTGEYPRATDTFIQREVAALRTRGAEVETLSIRRAAEREQVGPEQRAERERTFYVLPASVWALLKAHASMLAFSPRRYFGALGTAVMIRPPGVKAFARQLAYFAEAAVVAGCMRGRNLPHLHNHFSNSSCSVAMLAAEMGGFTFSFTMHGPAEFYEPKYWRIEEKIRRAAFVACISSFSRSQAMVFARQADWPKLRVVHCGVTPALFTPRRHEGRGTKLLFVGRLAGVKGVPVLLDVVARLTKSHPDVVLLLAGDGPDRASLEALARELGIQRHVRFLGYQSQAQVRELLAETDVFVMASFAEGVPVVLMEAMAAGVPVVTTRIAGIPELVEEDVSGFLVPPGEAKPLCDRIERLLGDADLRKRFAAAGRAKVEREFDVDFQVGKLFEAFAAIGAARRNQSRPTIPPP
jgi:colanic acid/amylovoran biosynthesis glycosyltransferase